MSVTHEFFTMKSRSLLNYSIFLLLIFLALPIMASETDKSVMGGFLSAKLGSFSEEVLSAINKDGIQITEDETRNGARQIRGQYTGPISTNQILYVIPDESKKLALIIEFFDNPEQYNQVIEELTKQLGKSLEKDFTAKILESNEDLPPGIKELTMWTFEAGNINLIVRAMRFDDHLAVERFDERFFQVTQ